MNINQAMIYYVKAGDKGDIYSQFMCESLILSESAVRPEPAPKKSAPSSDELFAQGMAYYLEEEYDSAINSFTGSGNSESMYMLGFMYENGLGRDKSLDIAKDYYLESKTKKAREAYERLSSGSWWPF